MENRGGGAARRRLSSTVVGALLAGALVVVVLAALADDEVVVAVVIRVVTGLVAIFVTGVGTALWFLFFRLPLAGAAPFAAAAAEDEGRAGRAAAFAPALASIRSRALIPLDTAPNVPVATRPLPLPQLLRLLLLLLLLLPLPQGYLPPPNKDAEAAALASSPLASTTPGDSFSLPQAAQQSKSGPLTSVQ